jgi:hypothetical protein
MQTSDRFPIQNCKKQKDTLSPFFQLCFGICNRRKHRIQKIVKALLDASEEVGQKVNSEKTKHVLMPRYHETGQKHSIQIAIRSFADVAKFKYLGTTLTDQNCMHEEIKSRLNLGNAYCHSVQRLLSARLLSMNVKVKIYKTIILPVALYECVTWSLTLREGHRLKVSENRVLRTLGHKREEVTGEMRNLHNQELHKRSLGSSKQGEWRGPSKWHAWERRENCTGFCWGNLKERVHSEDVGVDGRMGSDCILGGVKWIQLAEDRGRCRAVVNAVTNLRFLAPQSCYIIIILFPYHRFSFPWYFSSWASGKPHHSGFKSHIVALSLWCVMFLVRRFCVENLLNAVLVLFPDIF